MSKSVSRLRTTAFVRQNGLCFYCNLPMWLNDPTAFIAQFGYTMAQARIFQCTAEHLLPRSAGGQNCMSNIVAACLYCNTRRHRRRSHARTPEGHRSHVQNRMRVRRWHGFLNPAAQGVF